MPLGDLVVKVGGNVDGFKAAMADASQSATQFTSKITDSVAQGITLFDAYGRAVESAAKPVQNLKIANDQLAAAADRVISTLGAQSAATEKLAASNTHAVSEIQATSGALRTLEGNGGIRAAERFIATTLGLGSAMQAIFVPIGAIALASAIARIGAEIIHVVDNFFLMADAEKEVEAIGKEMAKQAENDIAEIGRLQVEALRAAGKLVEAAKKELENTVNKPIKLPDLEDPERKKKLSGLSDDQLKSIQSVYSEVLPADIPARIAQINAAMANTNAELDKIKANALFHAGGDDFLDPISLRFGKQDEQALILYGDALQALQIKQQRFEAEAGKGSADLMKAQDEERKKAQAAATEAQRKATEALRKGDEDRLAAEQRIHEMSIGQVMRFWQKRLAVEQENADRVHDINRTLGSLAQEQGREFTRIAEKNIADADRKAKEAEKVKSFLDAMAQEADANIQKMSEETIKLRERMDLARRVGAEQTSEQAIAMRRLNIEREYALLIAKTAQTEIANIRQMIDLDREALNAKLKLLEADRAAEKDPAKQLELDNKIAAAKDAAQQKEYGMQTRIQQIQQQNTVIGHIQIGLWNTFNNSFGKISSALANAITHVHGFGQAMKQVLQSIEQEILQTLIGAVMGKLARMLADHVAGWLHIKVASSAAQASQIAGNQAVTAAATEAAIAQKAVASALDMAQVTGAAAVAGAEAAAANAWGGPAAALAAGFEMFAAVAGAFLPAAAFEKGGLVPETMMAIVHKGEWVTPAAQVAQGNLGPRGNGGGNNVVINVHEANNPRKTLHLLTQHLKLAGGPVMSPAGS